MADITAHVAKKFKNVKVLLCLIKHQTIKTYWVWRYNSTIVNNGTRWG
jgi:hypothetical protein